MSVCVLVAQISSSGKGSYVPGALIICLKNSGASGPAVQLLGPALPGFLVLGGWLLQEGEPAQLSLNQDVPTTSCPVCPGPEWTRFMLLAQFVTGSGRLLAGRVCVPFGRDKS